MKRFLFLTAVITALLSTSALAAARYNDNYYNISTRAESGELMLEARTVFEAMGYTVSWEPNTKTTVFSNGVNTVNILSATGDAALNGNAVSLGVKPSVTNGVTYVPASLLKSMGITIDWDFEKAYPLLYSSDYAPAADENTSSKDSSVKEGWNTAHNEYYHNGSAVKGLNYVDGKMYNFGNGTLVTGIFTEGSEVKGYDEYGESYNGFTEKDGVKYYFVNGSAYTAPAVIDGKMYNFRADGALVTGWSESDGSRMYFNEFGYPVEGIVEIDGVKYYFVQGVMQTGAVVYNGNNYLFGDDGAMVTNRQEGDIYYGADGVGVKYSQAYVALMNRADSILAQTGKSPQAIYNYVASHVKYKYMAQQDWTTMAASAFNTGRGACYHYAACVDILLKRAGYETRVVRGTGHYTSLHYWNQVKINGAWTNIDACNKYYNATDAYLKSKNYTFNKYEYPVYY